LVCGLLFGAGLAVSQMINPAKVLAFLDFGGIAAGTWDPSLAFVMLGALLVAAPAYALGKRRGSTLFAVELNLPTRRDIDARLLGGAALFGAGWGLVGYCPGPALAGLGLGTPKTLIFVAAMLIGMLAYRKLQPRIAGTAVKS
jgi:uncharacterized membrane protein YedE/YeeE